MLAAETATPFGLNNKGQIAYVTMQANILKPKRFQRKDLCKMSFDVNEKEKILIKNATDAIQNQNWAAFNKAACYDAEVGNYLLALYEDRLPLEVKCRIALYHYSNRGDCYSSIRKYVRKAGIIRPENWREALPSSVRNLNMFTIYRGGGDEIKKAPYSMSWTLSQEVAEWFMRRHKMTHPEVQHLYRGTIAAEKIVSYIGGRSEYEIVQYRGIKDVEEISPVGISSSFEEMRMSRDPHQVVSQESANAYFDKWYECIRK